MKTTSSFCESTEPFARWLLRVLALAVALGFGAHAALADHGDGGREEEREGLYAIGLWGDMPYSDIQQNFGVPNLIADMNEQKLEFTVHDGDLKAGGTPCTDDVYTRGLGYFNALRGAAMFTPGDNDWTDCDRGGSDPLERLDFERKLFFSTPFSLGRQPIRQQVQPGLLCLGQGNVSVQCAENRRWTFGRVTYVTLNVQGSCNNLCDVGPNPAEYAARNAANIAWLKETFAEAKLRRSAAVMIISQANPGFDQADPTRSPSRNPRTLVQIGTDPDGYREFLLVLRDLVTAFKRPVAYVHGDSHYYRTDRPLLDAQGQRLENFTRVETFGDHQENGVNDVHWLKVFVDPRSREVFAYQTQIVPLNRVAVTAP